jgi:hypothetical protein
MSDEKTTPTFGYHKTKAPQIFDLKEGESLPKGWADTPAAFDKPEDEKDEAKSDAN